MRQIKFRGKRVDNGEWVYGSYHYSYNGKHHYILALEKFNERVGKEMMLHKAEVNEVAPPTVGQFTGLLDKNGKEIWEGDVAIDKRERKVKVVWVDEYACFALETIDDIVKGEYNFSISDTAQVIGDLHDNPLLLTNK